jgi:hypothetical protein
MAYRRSRQAQGPGSLRLHRGAAMFEGGGTETRTEVYEYGGWVGCSASRGCETEWFTRR